MGNQTSSADANNTNDLTEWEYLENIKEESKSEIKDDKDIINKYISVELGNFIKTVIEKSPHYSKNIYDIYDGKNHVINVKSYASFDNKTNKPIELYEISVYKINNIHELVGNGKLINCSYMFYVQYTTEFKNINTYKKPTMDIKVLYCKNRNFTDFNRIYHDRKCILENEM